MVWQDLQHVMHISFPTNCWLDITNLLKPISKGKTVWSVIRRLVLAGAIYHIWQERNNRIFKNKRISYHAVVKTVIDDVRCRLVSLS